MRIIKLKNNFAIAGTMLFALNMLASVTNYICQFFMGKYLSIDSFGTLNAIFSVLVIIGVPGAALMPLITKYLAECCAKNRKSKLPYYLTFTLITVSFLAITVVVGGIVAYLLFGKYFNIVNTGFLFVMLVLAAITYYYTVVTGALNGIKAFMCLGIIAQIIPAFKLFGVLLAARVTAPNSSHITIILGFMLIGTIVAIVSGFAYLRHTGVKVLASPKALKHYRFKVTFNQYLSLIINLCLMFYMNVDVLMVRAKYDALQTGLYSSVQLFGRVIFYFATSIVMVMLPLVAGSNDKSNKQLKYLINTLLCTGALVVLCLVPLNIFPQQILGMLFGDKYLMAIPYMKYTSLISVALSLNTILANYLLAQGKLKFLTCSMVISSAVMAIVCLFYFGSAESTLSILAIIGYILFFVNFAYILKRPKNMQ